MVNARTLKRRDRLELLRHRLAVINRMRDEMATLPEVATALQMSEVALRLLCQRYSMRAPSRSVVRLVLPIPASLAPAVEGLASRAGVSNEAIMRRLASILLRDNAVLARRVLGKEGLPKAANRRKASVNPPRGKRKLNERG